MHVVIRPSVNHINMIDHMWSYIILSEVVKIGNKWLYMWLYVHMCVCSMWHFFEISGSLLWILNFFSFFNLQCHGFQLSLLVQEPTIASCIWLTCYQHLLHFIAHLLLIGNYDAYVLSKNSKIQDLVEDVHTLICGHVFCIM